MDFFSSRNAETYVELISISIDIRRRESFGPNDHTNAAQSIYASVHRSETIDL